MSNIRPPTPSRFDPSYANVSYLDLTAVRAFTAKF
jgi:hypothetical protein